MIIETAAIFKAASVAQGAAVFLGLTTTKLSAKLDLLSSSEFEAGMRALRQASESENEQESLLREARARFNKAVSLETGSRRAFAHLGLAFCHWSMHDQKNAKRSLEELLDVPQPELTFVQGVMTGVVAQPVLAMHAVSSINVREAIGKTMSTLRKVAGTEDSAFRTWLGSMIALPVFAVKAASCIKVHESLAKTFVTTTRVVGGIDVELLEIQKDVRSIVGDL